jgi:hypothetical protein
MQNIYRESDKWIRFANVHRAKWAVMVAYTLAYFTTAVVLVLAQRNEWLFMGGKLGALLNLVFFLGGQVLFLFIFIPLFNGSYLRWRDELGKLFGSPVRAGRMHFYHFAMGRNPVEELARIRDLQIERVHLESKRATAQGNLASAEKNLELSLAKQELLALHGKFRSGSREDTRLERALRKGTDVRAIRALVEELSALEPHSDTPDATPARDKIAELEETFRAEEAQGDGDAEATRLFNAAQQEKDRKKKRGLLVEAIAKLKAANKKQREREERFAAHKRAQTNP